MKTTKKQWNFPSVQRLILCALCALCAAVLAGCGGQETPARDDVQASNISETVLPDEATADNVDMEPVALPPVSEELTALEDVQNYLSIMALSREGLIELLVYDGFSVEEAQTAADSCGADWNEQAARQARSYLDTMDYTRDELIDQLEYDKFTPEEAVYGADNCGADWN